MPQRPARVVYSENSTKRIILPDWYMPALDPDAPKYVSECGKFWYDPYEAWRWENWPSEYCVHVDGKMGGQPLEMLDWQRGPTREIFGWRRFDKDGKRVPIRKIRKALIGVPRKNSKTTWGASLCLGMTKIDNEIAPQNYMVAATEKQTKDNGYRMARQMVQLSEALRIDCEFEDYDDHIFEPKNRGVLRGISATPKGKTGGNTHLLYVDELHEFPDFQLIHNIWTGSTARDQPLLLMTTTTGDDPDGPWAIEWEYARDVMTGNIVDDYYFGLVFEPDKDDDWLDRKVWAKCNPGWGQSVNVETLEDIFKSSKTPDAIQKFQQMHLCMTHAGSEAFVTKEDWEACFKDYDWNDLRDRRGFGGIDLAKKDDMTAFGMVFPYWQDDQIHYDTYLFSFCPSKKVKERDLMFKYSQWVDMGVLTKTEGKTTDYRVVRNTIKTAGKHCKIEDIGFDDWHAPELVGNLQDEDGFTLTEVPQTMRGMGPATIRLEELILAGQIHHNGNPILRWNISNVRVVRDRVENKMLSKGASKEKIDGLVAITIALSRAMVAPPPPKPKRMWIIQP